MPPYLAVLNEAQRAAVFHGGESGAKPLLILAGAGSGKTRVITTKIAYMIRELGIKPWSILAVTFTNKAAREMAERAAAIEPLAADSMLRTFHSFGAWFLRRNAEAAGISANFTIYDDDDAVSLLGAILPNKDKKELRLLAGQISRAKDRNLGPNDDLSPISSRREFAGLYAAYEKRLRETGNVDFGDLIRMPIETLRANPELARRIHGRFRVIMVDEYQDANVAQFELLRELAGGSASAASYICVVGDDDQSIYRFRGADITNILSFPERFGDADIVKLEQNYRSTGEILDLAHSVVRNNRGRHGKKLESARGKGIKPKLVFCGTQDDEAAFCAKLIKDAVAGGGSKGGYANWAVLYRVNAQSLGFENEFVRQKIPYKIVGSLKFYEREEIKDALALLAFMLNPRDEVNFRRIVNKPARGLGAQAVEKILAERWNEQGWNIETALKRMCGGSSGGLSAKAKNGAKEFLAAIAEGRAAITGAHSALMPNALNAATSTLDSTLLTSNPYSIKSSEGLSRCVAMLIEKSGIAAYHLEHDEVAGEQRIANLQELVNTATLYPASEEGLTDFLEHIELDRDAAQKDDGGTDDRVTLITLHNTKGLEFRNVIMTGLEQGLFPRDDKHGDDLEEERRLFYVGVTRAMDRLYITSCQTRRVWGRTDFMEPSAFLLEADKSVLDVKGDVPFGFGGEKNWRAGGGSWKPKKWNEGNQKPNSQLIKPVKKSSDGRWQIGDKIFNDDNGYGEVNAISEGEDGPVITVVFETGRKVKFLSAVQSKNYMKIKE